MDSSAIYGAERGHYWIIQRRGIQFALYVGMTLSRGYITLVPRIITSFGERTTDVLASACRELAANAGLQGLVIDLRGNPGGLLQAAVDVCDVLLEEGVIVSTRGRRESGTAVLSEKRATAGRLLADVPIAVLVDGLSSSSAEIVAACLQDVGRAVVVGSRTFGKGTVQTILPLSDNAGLLKITTAEYLRPSREPIHRHPGAGEDDAWGVRPDAGFEVTPTAEASERLREWRRRLSGGAPLHKRRCRTGSARQKWRRRCWTTRCRHSARWA